MKTLKLVLFAAFVMGSIISCNAQKSENAGITAKASDNIEVYYFHFTKRCVTCNAVETEAKLALENFYSNELSDGEITFTSLNLDETSSKKLAQNLKVSGQALLIVRGEERVNLTSEGFMNARTNPEKFHEILKTQIDKLL